MKTEIFLTYDKRGRPVLILRQDDGKEIKKELNQHEIRFLLRHMAKEVK